MAGPTIDRKRTVPINEDFERYLGTMLLAPFGGAFLDQVVLDDVSAGVEWSGRFRLDPYGRALRTGAVDLVYFGGDAEARSRTGEWLRRAHEDVHGTHDGVRFSALRPDAWNWIIKSALHLYLHAYPVITGDPLTANRAEQLYQYLLYKVDDLMLPAQRDRFPRTVEEFTDDYAHTLATRAIATVTLERESRRLIAPPVPPGLPRVLRPGWTIARPLISRGVVACSFGITDSRVRNLSAVDWSAANERDFQRARRILPLLYRLPRRLTMHPLAYHSFRARRLTEALESTRLPEFSPDQASSGSSGCPF
ncbi:oxygenase MpaB family protein [Gordonia malaquae]|uniref:oxygenase MpaB family protein n=1 Tax=Gordonia malaquae TaxID=410332 RepID=UPI0030FF3E3A